jgi:hypothetical protein
VLVLALFNLVDLDLRAQLQLVLEVLQFLLIVFNELFLGGLK